MSPGGTMVRVYTEVRRCIMEGEFRPGVRLDPTRLGKEMAASMTPVRDALHQLRGEGLVESWSHEGFWIAELTESVIRDRYRWCRDLVHLCLGDPGPHPTDAVPAQPEAGHAGRLTHALLRIAAASSNHEHRRAMANACDRCFILCKTEAALLTDADADIGLLQSAIDHRKWRDCLRIYEIYHERRMQSVPQIAELLRSR